MNFRSVPLTTDVLAAQKRAMGEVGFAPGLFVFCR